MNNITDIICERAVVFLAAHAALSRDDVQKPRLMHALRVGMYLYERKYGDDIIVAGFLHDTIEWEVVTVEMVKRAFGEHILSIVIANTKDRSREHVVEDMIERCVTCGQEALIVKTADIIDSFVWYTAQNNMDELKCHCVKTAEMIFRYKPQEWNDHIYDELEKWLNKSKKVIQTI